MLLVKGKLDAERPPIIKINGKSIRMGQAIKYLGVYLERGLIINRHAQEITHKNRKLFSRKLFARLRESGQGELMQMNAEMVQG